MKSVVAVLALLAAGANVAAEDSRPTAVITGCVHQGKSDESYVLTNVSEVPPRVGPAAPSIYWLTHAKDLKDHVGQMVEVTGRVSVDPEDAATGSVKVTIDPGKSQEKLKVKTDSHEVTLERSVTPASGSKDTAEADKPVVRFHVDAIKMVSASCS